jgi:hypothetical protein
MIHVEDILRAYFETITVIFAFVRINSGEIHFQIPFAAVCRRQSPSIKELAGMARPTRLHERLRLSLPAQRSNLLPWGIAGGTGILPVILVDRRDACPTIHYSR